MLFELRQFLGQARATWAWARRGYGAPYPHYMKQATLLRYAVPRSVFVETGTYRGSTSRYFAKRGFKVVTVEVHQPLFDRYSPGLRSINIDARLGDSGELLPGILNDYASSDAFSIFLDGHYSGGVTGQGTAPVPVVKEFDAIIEFFARHPDKAYSILIDDWRLFMPDGDATYPLESSLIAFAERLSIDWKLENDIFVVSSRFRRAEASSNA